MIKKIALFTTILLWQSAFAKEIAPAKTALNHTEKALISWVDTNKDPILSELKQHVEMNTGTANIAGLDAYRNLLNKELSTLNFTTETFSSDAIDVLTCKGGKIQIADHLIASKTGKKGPKLLLNGHMDTVFSKQDEFQTLNILEDGTLKGPGVLDMKGGIVIMLNALRALSAQGLLKDVNITILLNSDEEIGSLGSRELIEQLAKQHEIGVVFEGSKNNQLTRARKGLGQARLKITGRESHAGAAHAQGVSAVLEMAHKIIQIEALTNYKQGSTVNVGVMQGGEKRNTTPGCADAYIDMRYTSQSEGDSLQNELKQISAEAENESEAYPGLPKLEFWSTLHRPVKAQNPKVDALIAQAMGLSELIGEPIVGTQFSGGGTDGSIMQNVGLPTIDSLGLDGSGAHSSREEASVQSLIARTKLAAVMLYRLINSEQ